MIRTIMKTGVMILYAVVIASAAPSDKVIQASITPFQAIEQDFQTGKLTLDEKVLLHLKALKRPDQLPAKYQTKDGRVYQDARGATMVIRDMIMRFNDLEHSTQVALKSALARVSTEFTFDSQGGFFKLHYDSAGIDSVPSADLDSNGVPDFVERIAAYCDTTISTHLALGYLSPPSDSGLGGDSKYDIYFEETLFFGFAVPEGNGSSPWNDVYSHIVLNSDFLGFESNDDPEGDAAGSAKATIAHEFHHAVQFAYDWTEDIWFMEMDATYIEDLVFDNSDDNYNFLDKFFLFPEKSLMENSSHYYSCFIWPLYLAQKFDTSLMVAVWEGARFDDGLLNILGDSLLAGHGWTQDSAFADFAIWNFITSIRDDGLHHEEADRYALVDVGNSHSFYPVITVNSPAPPSGYAAAYVEFFPPVELGTLRLTFNGSNSRDWVAFVVKSTSENSHEIEQLVLDGITKSGEIEIPRFEDYFRVALIGVNVSEFAGGAFFAYSGDVIQPRSLATDLATGDTIIYSGSTRLYEFQITNDSEFDDVVNIYRWDTANWVVPDTVMRSIPAGQAIMEPFVLGPPQGTAIGSMSDFFFSVRSVNDSLAVDTQSIAVEAILQVADVNFSGDIDITDLTYLVAYMFSGGPEPLPSLSSASFKCGGDVTITDLTAMVSYQFGGGPPPACNPY